MGGATGGSGNLSTNLSKVARLAARVGFNANYDGTIIYSDPVLCFKFVDNCFERLCF
jgi:hypothetical protein